MTRRVAMISGSFDPVTSGHVDLILRAARMFDLVYVAVMSNGEKDSAGHGMFRYAERLAILEAACRSLPLPEADCVRAELCAGLASEYAAARGVRYIVRGVRSASDLDYELSLAAIMRRFDASLETVLLPARPELACVSSTYVRELVRYGQPIADAMPAEAAELAVRFWREKQQGQKEDRA